MTDNESSSYRTSKADNRLVRVMGIASLESNSYMPSETGNKATSTARLVCLASLATNSYMSYTRIFAEISRNIIKRG